MTAHRDHVSVLLDFPDRTTTTVETRAGSEPVTRHFVDLVVIACSEASADEIDVATALGAVVGAYRDRPGYSRKAVADPGAAGAVSAGALDFEWRSESDVPMASRVVALSDGSRVTTLHAAYPVRFSERCRPIAQAVLASARPATEAQ